MPIKHITLKAVHMQLHGLQGDYAEKYLAFKFLPLLIQTWIDVQCAA